MKGLFLIRLSDEKAYSLESESIIGRMETCDVSLSDEAGVSRQHAKVSISGDEISIQDLGSTNGVLVNNEIIDGSKMLKHNDVLIFDEEQYRLICPELPGQSNSPPSQIATEQRPRAEEPTPEMDEGLGFVDQNREIESPPVNEQTVPGKSQFDSSDISADLDIQEVKTRESISNPVLTDEEVKIPSGDSIPDAKSNPRWVDSGYLETEGRTTVFDTSVEVQPIEVEDFPDIVKQPLFLVQSGKRAGSVLVIPDNKEHWTIGSSDTCDLLIKDAGVSAKHATLSLRGSKWEIADQMTANTTTLNGNRIFTGFLNNNDVIRFGPVSCKFGLPGVKAESLDVRKKSHSLIRISSVIVFVIVAALIGYLVKFKGLLESIW